MHTDFNLHCLPGMDFGLNNDAALLVMQTLERCEIKRAVLTPAFDHTRDSIRTFIRRRDEIMSQLRHAGRLHVELQPAATIRFSPGISALPELSHLAASGTPYLYLSLPLKIEMKTLDTELHEILFRHRLKPIFADFDVATILYEPDQLYKIMSTPYAVFQFNISSLRQKPVLSCIQQLLDMNKRILFGSGIKDYANRTISYDLPVKRFEKLRGAQNFHYYMLKNDRFLR